MIHFGFRLSNPWKKYWNTIYLKFWRLGKNKILEFNVYSTNDIIHFSLDITTRCDHAGVQLMIGLLGRAVELHYYDTRHWNWETGRYNDEE